MTDLPDAPEAVRRSPMPRGWRVTLAIVVFLGTCQMLAMTPLFDASRLPFWLGGTIALTGFIAFLVLGFTLNAVLAVVMPLLLWRGQGWPFWQAVLPALPFWIVVYYLLPKPW